MTALEYDLPGDLGARLFVVEDRLLVTRYRRAMRHLGLTPTRLDAFRVDAAGWSPEVAAELRDPHYLGRGVSHPAFLVLTVDQLAAPLLQPNAGYGALAYLEWATHHRPELAELTLREAVVGAVTPEVTRFRTLSQLGLVRRLRLEVETPSGRLARAHELSALRAELLAEGDAWRDEDHLARMAALAEVAGGWSDVPEGMAPGRELPVGPSYLAEFGGCHLLPGEPGDPAEAWLLGQPGTELPEGADDLVTVIPATVETVTHFLVARGLVDPTPRTTDLDPVMLEELRAWLAEEVEGGRHALAPDLEEVDAIRLYCQGRPRALGLGGCSPQLRLRLLPVLAEDPARRWWVQHLRASLDPFARARLGRSRGGPLHGLFPFFSDHPTNRKEVAA